LLFVGGNVRLPEICAVEPCDRIWPISDRDSPSRSPTGVTLGFCLFRDLQCVVYVDAEVLERPPFEPDIAA